MSRRIVPVTEWASVHEAVLDDDSEITFAKSPRELTSSVASSSTTLAPASSAFNSARFRSKSHSYSSRRRTESLMGVKPEEALRVETSELSTRDAHEQPGQKSFKGLMRRASMSLKGFVHHSKRHSVTHPTVVDVFDETPRPATSHPTWQRRLRQAASFRNSRTSQGAVDAEAPRFDQHFLLMPQPGSGNEPPVIPEHTGAGAKAAVAAAQNEAMANIGVGGPQNKWLTSFDELASDRESGIGITVTGTEGEVETEDADADNNISRIDFIASLPIELGIQILSCLDASSLSAAALVSRRWETVVENQHVWRDAFLRAKTATFATSRPIEPGSGKGVPAIQPEVDWKAVYRVRQQLDRSWREGKARPAYLNGHLDSIYCLQFDETKIVTGSRDRTIRVWDIKTLKCRLVVGPPEVVEDPETVTDAEGRPVHYAVLHDGSRTGSSIPDLVSFPMHHQASILCLQYDEEMLVTGSSDGTCIVYSVAQGYRPIRRLQHHTAAVLDLAFDDRHIVTCSKDVSICVWDRHTGALLRQLRGHAGPVNAVQLRGNTIVSCSGDFRVKLWNVDTGKNIREFVGHTKGLACSQFTEDGRFVASAGNDKVIRVWDANTGDCVHDITAHDNLVRSLHVDSVSGRLVSGSYDTDIKVFDMESGRQLLDFPSWHASWVLSAKSDYRRIVSTGQDPKILVLDFGAHIDGIDMLESPGSLESSAA